MNRTIGMLLMAVGITGTFNSPLTAAANVAVADIPFAFVASGLRMPAGHYRVAELEYGSSIFSFSDGRQHAAFVSFGKLEDGNPQHPSLTFACQGKECVLAKVTPPNSNTAFALTENATQKNASYKLGTASMISVKLGKR